EVDRVGCVEDEDLGRILRRPAVDGAVLAESGEQRRLAPGVLVEHPVDAHRRRLDAGGAHVELSPAPVVDRLWIGGGLDEQEENGEHGTKSTMRNVECRMRNA